MKRARLAEPKVASAPEVASVPETLVPETSSPNVGLEPMTPEVVSAPETSTPNVGLEPTTLEFVLVLETSVLETLAPGMPAPFRRMNVS